MISPFSHELRVLTCGGCMAPMEVSLDGGSVTCEYCDAVNQIRRRDESADITAAKAAAHEATSELERVARLREQDGQPAPLPESITALLTDGQLAADKVDQAHAAWQQAMQEIEAAPGFPASERLFHLTQLLSPVTEPRRRRAMLETSIEVLTDEGHRQVLRCMLATAAARAGDLSSAAAWLAPVNPRPVNLLMDTAYRLAAATLASARGEHDQVTRLLGSRPDDVPLANRDEIVCHVLRLDALDHLGRGADASAEVATWIKRWGAERVKVAIDTHLPLQPCGGPFAAAQIQLELDRLRPQVAGLEHQLSGKRARFNWMANVTGIGLGTIILSLIIAGAWVFPVSCVLKKDPLLGAHAAALCPTVCSGCAGPYRFVSWTVPKLDGRRDHTLSSVYCHDPGGRVAATKNPDLSKAARQGAAWLEACEVPGGEWGLWLTMIFFFAPLVLISLVVSLIRGARQRREDAALLESKLQAARASQADLQRRLGELNSAQPPGTQGISTAPPP